jgi:hypothetical protein
MNSSRTIRLFALTAALFSLCALLVLGVLSSAHAQQPKPQGNVLTPYSQPVGAVDEEGIVTNAYGSKLGSVGPDGSVYNVSDIFIGRVYPNGDIFNQAGDYLGYVDAQGNVYNVSDIKIGSVQTDGNIILAGGAARIIFFRSSKGVRHKPRLMPLPR